MAKSSGHAPERRGSAAPIVEALVAEPACVSAYPTHPLARPPPVGRVGKPLLLSQASVQLPRTLRGRDRLGRHAAVDMAHLPAYRPREPAPRRSPEQHALLPASSASPVDSPHWRQPRGRGRRFAIRRAPRTRLRLPQVSKDSHVLLYARPMSNRVTMLRLWKRLHQHAYLFL